MNFQERIEELVNQGWECHSQSETGSYMCLYLSAMEVIREGRFLTVEDLPYAELVEMLTEGESLVSIAVVDGKEQASLAFEEWHVDPRQYDYYPLRGYFAVSGVLHKRVPLSVYRAIRAAS